MACTVFWHCVTLTTLKSNWKKILHVQTQNGTKIVSICGASGSGKTTICRLLSTTFSTYFEEARENPYLQKLLEGSGDFDAAANQQWFLRRITNFVEKADDWPIVLDQDPSAIVFAYAKMFYDNGQMTFKQLAHLTDELIAFEEDLRKARLARTVFYLHAPPEVLRKRVAQRENATPLPPMQWYQNISIYFERLIKDFPSVVRISSTEMTAEDIAAKIRLLLAAND